MGDHRAVIDNKIDSLCEYTHCTIRLLNKLTENKIITRDESVEIERQPEGYGRNKALYTAIRRKDGDAFCKVASIMEDEETKQSNTVLSIFKTVTSKRVKTEKTYVLKSKWWPEEKFLVNSFYERKSNDGLLVEELFKILTETGNQTAVISQKVTVSGFGGVGKTTTAKWYAKHYEDNYDHIIWIDSGEGNLIKSFVQLNIDLKVDQRSESDLKNVARICFQTLENVKCLFIFDNAERYVGCDGIKDVLPKNEIFHTIITSRNREWGSDTGYGRIQQLRLDVFSTNESVNFLTVNLKQKSIQEQDLRQLCVLLGNLPLALQIATSTLNNHVIAFADYIKMIQRTDEIIGRTFDDYEKTINTALKASLDFIRQGEENKSRLAYLLLLLFGYIQPDNVSMDFFEAVEMCESWEIQAAMDLLETYSLVSIKRLMNNNEIISYEYSIHRLLQQVIRFNGKDTEEATLRKILSCEGHLHIKLLPYTLAAESLKEGFPKLRAELVDQLHLPGLILSRQFDEACRLSGIIYKDLETPASRFNHAICLKNCGLLDESLSHLRELFSYVPGAPDSDLGEAGLLRVRVEPTKVVVGSKIFLINMLKADIVEAKHIFDQIRGIYTEKTNETLNCIIQAFNSKFFENIGFHLSITANSMYLEKYNEHASVDVRISECTVDNYILQWRTLRQVWLEYARFTSWQCESLRIGNFFPPTLTHLAIEMKTVDFNVLDTDNSETFTNPCICLSQLVYLREIYLMNCTLTLTDVPLPMRLRSLDLRNVSFRRNGEIIHKLVLTELINLCSLKSVCVMRYGIEDSETRREELWLLDMTGKYNLDFVRLQGNSISCQNWKDANWTIERLVLCNVELKNNKMKIRALKLKKSPVELSDLPSTIQSLTLDFGISFARSPEDHFLENLKCLKIGPPFSLKSDFLSLLDKCPKLVSLKLDYWNNERDEVDVSALPSTIRELHLEGVRITLGHVRNLDRLVLRGYTDEETREILTKLRPEHLCYNPYIINAGSDSDLVDLIQCQFKTIALGPISWRNFKKCELSSYVDQEGKYYIFQNQRGTHIDPDKFSSYIKFPLIEH